jgi:hypothetical protein
MIRARPASLSVVALLAAVHVLTAQIRAAAPPTLTQNVMDLIPPVRAATSLSAWRVTHPSDSVMRQGGDSFEEDECATVTRRIALADGDTVGLELFFYVPSPPPDLTLPVGQTADQVFDRCQAGVARLTLKDTSDTRTLTLLHAVTSALDSLPAFIGTAHSWAGVEPGDRGGSYRSDDSIAVRGMQFSGREGDSKGGIVMMHGVSITILARRAPTGVVLDRWARSADDLMLPWDATDPRMMARTRAAFAIAAIRGRVGRDLASAFARMQPRSGRPQPRADTLAAALGAWLRQGTALPAPRRAAALVAADGVLDRWFGEDFPASEIDTAAANQFSALGALIRTDSEHYKDELYVTHRYTRNWLYDAYRIAPGSRAGGFAFLTLADLGFRTEVGCDSMARTVIVRGTDYLRRFPQSEFGVEIHLLLGRAWNDSLQSAGDASDVLRTRAIAEFTLGFLASSDRAELRSIWDDAWRLMAGLRPLRFFFECESE